MEFIRLTTETRFVASSPQKFSRLLGINYFKQTNPKKIVDLKNLFLDAIPAEDLSRIKSILREKESSDEAIVKQYLLKRPAFIKEKDSLLSVIGLHYRYKYL